MEITKTIEKLFQYIEKNGFPRTESVGLLQSREAYGKFNPSAGHHIVDPVIADNEPHELKSFSLLERCLRETDSSRIGLSNRHLSFFEMWEHTYYGHYEKLIKKRQEVAEVYYHSLIDILGLNPDNLLVTVMQGCDLDNLHLDSKETQEMYEIWCGLIGKDKVKRTKGRRNLFLARIPGAAGGTGAEIYYKMINDEYIEIGSQVEYHFIFRGNMNIHSAINGCLASALGLERLLMALENKVSIYDISLIRPIKDIVVKALNDGVEELYEDNINIIADHIRAITFIIYEKEKQVRELSSSQERILRNYKKNIDSQVNYLGINARTYEDMVDCIIDVYRDRYPDLSDKRNKILDFLKK